MFDLTEEKLATFIWLPVSRYPLQDTLFKYIFNKYYQLLAFCNSCTLAGSKFSSFKWLLLLQRYLMMIGLLVLLVCLKSIRPWVHGVKVGACSYFQARMVQYWHLGNDSFFLNNHSFCTTTHLFILEFSNVFLSF